MSRFVVLHALLAIALITAIAFGTLGRRRAPDVPPLRQSPPNVGPLYDYDFVVSDGQLRDVLRRLIPTHRGSDTRVNHIDHALRLWGPEIVFPADFENAIQGPRMRDILVDQRPFREALGESVQDLVVARDGEVRYRVQEGRGSSSHVDHTIATLAEIGTPLSHPLRFGDDALTLKDAVVDAMRRFRPNQVEYEWSASVFAAYLPPHKGWTTSEGQYVDFDHLAERIMREPMPRGVCFGNHRIYTLVMLIRIDQRDDILSADMRRQVHDYLLATTQSLVKHQHPLGFWNEDWPISPPRSAEPGEEIGDRLGDRLLATGHAMEWWAMAPEQLHPPRAVLASAGQWLAESVLALSDEEIDEYYTYLTHVGRALALWRHKWPPPADFVFP